MNRLYIANGYQSKIIGKDLLDGCGRIIYGYFQVFDNHRHSLMSAGSSKRIQVYFVQMALEKKKSKKI